MSFGADGFADLLDRALASADDPGAALSACAISLADLSEENEWLVGCPVATVALETVHSSVR